MVNIELGMVKVSFWLTKDGDDFVMSDGLDDAVAASRKKFYGTLEEYGGNYLTFCYDSIQEAKQHAAKDADLLERAVNQYMDDYGDTDRWYNPDYCEEEDN